MSLPSDPRGTYRPSRPHAILATLAGVAAGPAFVAAGWAVVATLPRSGRTLHDPASLQAPARLQITFGRPVDAALFEGQYQVEHLSLVLAMPHSVSVDCALIAGEPGDTRGANAFHWVTLLSFWSVSDLVASLSSPAGQAALSHVGTFATGGATARIVTNVPVRHPSLGRTA
jgi:hypothetical protein